MSETAFQRVEIFTRVDRARGLEDAVANRWLRAIEHAQPAIRAKVRGLRVADLYWVRASDAEGAEGLDAAIAEIFYDPILHERELSEGAWRGAWAIEGCLLPGVTDNRARTVTEAFGIVLGESDLAAASGTLWLLDAPALTAADAEVLARQVFCNPLIERAQIFKPGELAHRTRFESAAVVRHFPEVVGLHDPASAVETFEIADADPETLLQWNTEHLWALNASELQAIAHYFRDREQGRPATDVELEMLAQTWSEHCKHKIFGARIHYREEGTPSAEAAKIPVLVDGVFKQTIFETTRVLNKAWCLSVFDDNAGVIELNDEWAFCLKVETHNSPSALDPFGGALTGIVGVNRDILGCGLGARPILNTDVFCVAPLDTPAPIPERLLHPRRILSGVRLGVEHGGNQSGIPTVGGALVFDSRYLGKPLVYCGTGGLLPRKVGARKGESKEIKLGDRVVMCGGRIGKDGIHGATFSSLALDESSPLSAVQLGDPITQKRLADFLLEARDRGLYRAVTDNGAGGLSSSVGELAQLSGGVRVDLSRAPTKYPGLKPFEIWVSESQERMSLAVPPAQWEAFAELARLRGVEVSDLGEFTASGRIEIAYGARVVGNLALDFVHKGAPRLELQAVYTARTPEEPGDPRGPAISAQELLPLLLSRPNIASKEWLIRQYDHEVQGTSVLKPLVQRRERGSAISPNDASVIEPLETPGAGIALGMGIRPRLSDFDAWVMAQAAVDESVRNTLCVGGEWGGKDSVLALVDNFCWPDAVGSPAFAADLVRAGYGMREAALELGAPLISGKDSMKNDFQGRMPAHDGKPGAPVRISVPPTLLMTCVARVPELKCVTSAEFKNVGDVIYLLGASEGTLGLAGSEAADCGARDAQPARLPHADWKVARAVYGFLGGVKGAAGKLRARLRSAHDVSEGGLLVSIAESLFASGWGAAIEIAGAPDRKIESAFGEGFHRVVVSVASEDAAEFERAWKDISFARLGVVTEEPVLAVKGLGSWKVADLSRAWAQGPSEGYWQ